ncbi:ribose-phosphate pyrophosphokinase [Reichenbachiella carrageenanivorans]|uniref:ribose-phosphate diphosphokinase n=1 Tax=Reichenbachiella carrageenanivorans TaxID=2979869 RepID=A0ABY6D040_9BACT|nr:ribose-phosphate pyrophosphokinase [Reichenbachiella carrageenanivorans]UXX79522.1 ribose-phosphate pyrophosphokinase [Reichenbachiella carrageenanivorans]
MSAVKIFAGNGSRELATEIANSYGKPLGNSTSKKFSDGELSFSYNETVRGCDVFIIQSTGPSDNLIELLLMIDAAKRASAKSVTCVVPYYGYARQDRKDKPRVSIAAKLMANVLQAAGADRLMTCDLHADQIQGFFDIPVDHLVSASIFVPYIKDLKLDNLIFAAPDVGSTKRVREFAKFFEADMVVCDKHRKRANEIASMQVIGDVEGKNVILVDDIIDTAGTLTKAANLLKEKGAVSVRAFCTHPILSGNAYENVDSSELEELVVTDSIKIKEGVSSKIKVASMSELFAKAIRKIHDHESISSLFIQ